MSPLEQQFVLLTGLGAGVLTSPVGVASLLSFPVLVAVGLPPVIANASNTVGMTPGALSGSWGYRRELREHPRVTAIVDAASGLRLGTPAGCVTTFVEEHDSVPVVGVGGYVGAHIGRRLPPSLLRAGIVIAGVVGALLL